MRRRPALPGKPALSTQFLLISAVDLALLLYVIQAHRATNWQPLAAWLLAVGLFLAAAWQLDQEQADVAPLSLAWDRWDTSALVGLAGLALLLRIIWLERLPLTMHNDEAVMALAAQELRQGGLRGWYLLDTFGHSQLWYALLHGGMRLFGPSLFGLRMVAVFFGTATMGTTYLLVRLLFNRPLALLSTLLLATFHFHVHFSRIGLNNVTDTFFGTLVALLLAAGLRQGSRFLLAATGVTLGIALHFYTGARLLVPLTLFMGATWYVDQWRHRGTGQRDPLPALAAAVMGGTATLYTLMPFAFAVI
ncbi:MAG: glycosyltransferase family 39 protein, partial [Caldilineaceae bacterium]|nr:glycosyltransferase family 39 protein [Caldilineaceae bacterium]